MQIYSILKKLGMLKIFLENNVIWNFFKKMCLWCLNFPALKAYTTKFNKKTCKTNGALTLPLRALRVKKIA